MNKVSLSIVLLLTVETRASQYLCKFGPDAYGEYVEELVDTGHAQHCGDFCECEGLLDNTCYFGPDDTGNFITEIVSSELADSCDRSFCVCESHNFEEAEVTFEAVLENRLSQAIDRTVKPHEQPAEEDPEEEVTPEVQLPVWEEPSFNKMQFVGTKEAFILILVALLLLFALGLVIIGCLIMKRRKHGPIHEIQPIDLSAD